MNPYAAHIYIDGCCYDNPGGKGGFAGILEMPDDDKLKTLFQEGYQDTTNNRMEIMALIYALEYIKKNSSTLRANGINDIEVFSDSETAVKCYNNVEQWRKNNWIGMNNAPVKNVDLLRQIITLKNSVSFSYKVEHICGKSNEPTKLVDRLAKQAAKKSFLKKDTGYIKPKVCRTDVKGSTEPYDAKGQEALIRVFEHSPVSRRKDSLYKVKFEVLNDGVKEKYYAYAPGAINAVLDRWHFYKTLFNDDPKNPRIENVEEVDEDEFLG